MTATVRRFFAWIVCASPILFVSRSWAAGNTQASPGGDFVPFDPATIQSVDGKLMMLLAYGVILTALLGYSASVFFRQRRVQKKAIELESRVQRYSTTRSNTQQ